jgi:hypothetical protein
MALVEIPRLSAGRCWSGSVSRGGEGSLRFYARSQRRSRFRRGTRDYAAGRTLVADQHSGRIPVQIEGRSAVLAMMTIANTDAGVAGAAESPVGSSRAITRLPALTRFAPRPLVLDLSDQVSAHFREGMIKVALVGRGHEVSPSR